MGEGVVIDRLLLCYQGGIFLWIPVFRNAGTATNISGG